MCSRAALCSIHLSLSHCIYSQRTQTHRTSSLEWGVLLSWEQNSTQEAVDRKEGKKIKITLVLRTESKEITVKIPKLCNFGTQPEGAINKVWRAGCIREARGQCSHEQRWQSLLSCKGLQLLNNCFNSSGFRRLISLPCPALGVGG